MSDKEATEIAFLIDCIKTNKTVDNLIEWDSAGTYINYENAIAFEYKQSKHAFFELHRSSKGVFLKSIVYFHLNFHKKIFLDDTLSKYKITDKTRFGVWMSKDRLSIYFCMINPDNPIIWVLTNGNTVYSP